MLEEGAEIAPSVWQRLSIAADVYHNNVTLLLQLYSRLVFTCAFRHVRQKLQYQLQLYTEYIYSGADVTCACRCSESSQNEAYIPCSLSYYRVLLTDFWLRHHLLLKVR